VALNRRMRLCGGVFVSSWSSDCAVVLPCDVWSMIYDTSAGRSGEDKGRFAGCYVFWVFFLHRFRISREHVLPLASCVQ
jgi:hypothetical protein